LTVVVEVQHFKLLLEPLDLLGSLDEVEDVVDGYHLKFILSVELLDPPQGLLQILLSLELTQLTVGIS
jgi:hypothetical protein